MERVEYQGKTLVKGYHTQEFRAMDQPLESPILCRLENAWLGQGYYFWVELEYARYWGVDYKMANTGSYDIYLAYIDIEKCLNTVFNEEHYDLYCEWIEQAQSDLVKEIPTGKKKQISLGLVNKYLKEKYFHSPENSLEIKGIIYGDTPVNKSNRSHSIILEKENRYFYHKKRIQIAIFELPLVHYFDILEENCNTKC